MGKEQYISEANRQLSDTTYYKRLDEVLTSDHQRLVRKWSPQRKSVTTTSNISQSKIPAQADSISSPKFTNLATLDSQLFLQTVTQPNRSQSLLTYTICLYITTVCPRYNISYQATPSDISKETLLISLDVVSLYTSIPNEDGIEACREARNTRETMDQIISGPCNRCVEMQHLWIQWRPLPSRIRYSYGYKKGSIICQHFHHGLFEKTQLLMLVPLKPHMWLRFTDDIDIQWCHSRKDLHGFLDKANTFHKTIKFTSEFSNDNHVFWGAPVG